MSGEPKKFAIGLAPRGMDITRRIDGNFIDIIGETGLEPIEPHVESAANAIVNGVHPKLKFEEMDQNELYDILDGRIEGRGWKLEILTKQDEPSKIMNCLHGRLLGLNNARHWKDTTNLAYKGYLAGSFNVVDSKKTSDDGSVRINNQTKLETLYVSDDLLNALRKKIQSASVLTARL